VAAGLTTVRAWADVSSKVVAKQVASTVDTTLSITTFEATGRVAGAAQLMPSEFAGLDVDIALRRVVPVESNRETDTDPDSSVVPVAFQRIVTVLGNTHTVLGVGIAILSVPTEAVQYPGCPPAPLLDITLASPSEVSLMEKMVLGDQPLT